MWVRWKGERRWGGKGKDKKKIKKYIIRKERKGEDRRVR